MRRRALLAGLLTLGVVAKARAQAPGRIYRLGVLGPGDASSWLVSPMRTITLAKLAEYGFAEDHNLQVQVHFGSGESLPELAQELVTAQPDVIVAIQQISHSCGAPGDLDDPDRDVVYRRGSRCRRPCGQYHQARGECDGPDNACA